MSSSEHHCQRCEALKAELAGRNRQVRTLERELEKAGYRYDKWKTEDRRTIEALTAERDALKADAALEETK